MIVVGSLATNCYLVYDEESGDCVIIDPGADGETIIRRVEEMGLHPLSLINTHGHVDHVGANRDLKDRYDVPLCIHAADKPILGNILNSALGLFVGARRSPEPDRLLAEGDEILFGSCRLEVIHTPGHSPGSICLYGEDTLFAGDLLFFGGVGRTDLPGGSWEDLENSIRNKIYLLPDETRILPGHGPSTTVSQEKRSNPFIR